MLRFIWSELVGEQHITIVGLNSKVFRWFVGSFDRWFYGGGCVSIRYE